MNRSKGTERWIHCYKSSQKILLVGEGDFSFSACLARAFRTAENMVATSYLDRNLLDYYHWTSLPHLEELERLGCLLLYNVDVYKMHTHPKLKNMKFDIIIFNFPHAGHFDYLCERDSELIEMHVDLVEAYFKSASKMLTEGGEVHLRHREDSPYDSWNVVSLAAKARLTLKEKVFFDKRDYPGYHNKRGGGINTNKTFPIKCAFTYKFAPYLPEVVDRHCYELPDKVHDDKIQVLCGKDTVYDNVNVSTIKEEDHVNNKFQEDKVIDLLETDEANADDLFVQKNGKAYVDIPNSDIVVNDLDHVHGDLKLPKVIDHGYLLEKDKVNVEYDLPRVVDDYSIINEIQKFDKMHLENDDDDHDFPEKGEVGVLETKQDLYRQHIKTDKVHEDDQQLLKNEDDVHVDSKPQLDGSARLKAKHVARSGIICNFCLPAEWLLTWFET